MQLHAAISCRPKLSPRREKKADVSAQSRGQMGRWRCAGCGNRICLEAAIRTSRARSHPRNFVSAPVAGPTATRRRSARFCRMGSPRAREAGRAGRALVPWLTGTECTCPRTQRSQRDAAAADCHSRVHCVWGPKKVRYSPKNRKFGSECVHRIIVPVRMCAFVRS